MDIYHSKYRITVKDVLIVLLFVGIVIANIISTVLINGYTGVGDLIEQTVLIVLSFVGLIEIASYCNWHIIVPDFFIFYRKKERRDEIETYMMEYFRDDIKFLQDYNEERIRFILSQIGISISQLDEIRLCIIKMRCMPLKTFDDAKRKIEYYVKNDYPMVITQKNIDVAKLCYHDVNYYINFTDPMFLPEYAQEIASLLSFLIKEKADLNRVDRLIVPYDSNFLLGVEVSKRLGKPMAKMRFERGKIITAQPWEGQLNLTDRVIIIHDVLVKADQIIHTLEQLPRTCEVLGIYCLITRKEWKGVERLKQKGLTVEQIVCLNDNDISTIREEK